MRYRKLSSTGDYVFGSSALNFLTDIDAVRQAILTRLQLYKGAFWRSTTDGLPMFQSILSTPGSAENLAAIDGIIRQRILGTPGVSSMVGYASNFDRNTREYSFTATVLTIYSQQTTVQGTF